MQRGLPIQMLVKHFKQVGELWQLNADIRAMVQHRQLNLLQDFSHLGTFDVIFCRNVLIYFDQDTKVGIFDRLARVIEPDGVLALGAAESVVGISDAFKPYPERRGLYRPNAARAVRAWCRGDDVPMRRLPRRRADQGLSADPASRSCRASAEPQRSRAAGSARCCR